MRTAERRGAEPEPARPNGYHPALSESLSLRLGWLDLTSAHDREADLDAAIALTEDIMASPVDRLGPFAGPRAAPLVIDERGGSHLRPSALRMAAQRLGSDAQRAGPRSVAEAFAIDGRPIETFRGVADLPAAAAATAEAMWFRDADPPDHVVAHELAHVAQYRHGHASDRASSEREAQAAARTATTASVGSLRPQHRPPAPVAFYVGEDECLPAEVVAALDDDSVREAASGARVARDRDLSVGAGETLTTMEFELANRGLTAEAPPAGPLVIDVGGYQVSDDPVHTRFVLEAALAALGTDGLRRWHGQVYDHLERLRVELADIPATRERERARQRDYDAHDLPAGVPWSPEMYAELDRRETTLTAERDAATTVGRVVDEQYLALTTERADLLRLFGATAKELTRQVLTESGERVRGELRRYGIVAAEPGAGRGHAAPYNLDDTAETLREREGMMTAAAAIVTAETRRRQLEMQRDEIDRADRAWAADPIAGVRDLDAGVVAGDPYAVCVPDDPALVGDVREVIGHALALATTARDEARAVGEAEYPIIAAYTSGDLIDLEGLTTLATSPDLMEIGASADQKLANIAEVLAALDDGDLDVWQRPEIVALTARRLQVVPGSWRDRVIRERQADSGDGWTTWAILGITLALGIIAAIPTAGASLGVTALVVGAEIAGVALDVYLLSQSVADYQLAWAMTDTDFDRARLLSQDEPSLFWLAVEVVGTVVGAAFAMRTFREVAHARRAVLAARSLDALDSEVARLRALMIESGLSSEAQARLLAQLASEHPRPDLVEELIGHLGRDGAELAPPAEVARALGVRLTDAAASGDVRALAVAVNAPVEIADDLADGVRVLPSVGRRGQIGVAAVRIGPAATVADVLAHREVVSLMRRLEGLTGEAATLWDDLMLATVDASGRINPFPVGSAAHSSWFELRKYPELIGDRVARLGDDGVSAAERELLRDDISFFETELSRHRENVAQAVMERGADFVERAARSNEAAFGAGYPRTLRLADGREFPIGLPGSQFYYRADPLNAGEFIAVRYIDAVDAPALAVRRSGAGFEIVEGTLSREEAAAALVRSWPDAAQRAYAAAAEAALARHGDDVFRVVPLAGIHRMEETIGVWLEESRDELRRILREALHRSSAVPRGRSAERMIQELLEHRVTVVRGTDQLRAFGYRRHYATVAGAAAEGEVHHWIPLYLGGDHRFDWLLDLDPEAHDEIHEIFEAAAREGSDITLSPNSIGRLDARFDRGYAVILNDGRIEFGAL